MRGEDVRRADDLRESQQQLMATNQSIVTGPKSYRHQPCRRLKQKRPIRMTTAIGTT